MGVCLHPLKLLTLLTKVLFANIKSEPLLNISLFHQVPNLIWREVMLELDYPGFFLPSPEALSLIMTTHRMVSRDPFPLEVLYLGWDNPKGQVEKAMMK